MAGEDGTLYQSAHGHFTYTVPPPCSTAVPAVALSTLFDLASLTKVLATTTATMVLYQQGLLSLDTAIADDSLLGPDYAVNGKAAITVRNLLLHDSG